MDKIRYLRFSLRLLGIANLITAFAIPVFFGDLLLWTPRNLPTELMVGSLYFAMGIVMLVAARNPLEHRAFLEFAILANVLHAMVMVVFAETPVQIVVDAGFIGIQGIVLLVLYPWGIKNFLRHGKGE
ncbi:MAG: hypothetical protein GTO18_15255 [Anaerolineales bacterium]|nr:hypothetical protein [Anaerolineales bacterium]